jgi:hypothetical protein
LPTDPRIFTDDSVSRSRRRNSSSGGGHGGAGAGCALVGHKGADRIVPEHPESFAAAVGPGRHDRARRALLPDALLLIAVGALVTPDWEDAERRTPLQLTEALDLFLAPPPTRSDRPTPPPAARGVVFAARTRPRRARRYLDDEMPTLGSSSWRRSAARLTIE